MFKMYNTIRPFGSEAADLRAGIVAGAITGKKAIDHMPIVAAINNTPTGPAKSTAELLAKAKRMAARFNKAK